MKLKASNSIYILWALTSFIIHGFCPTSLAKVGLFVITSCLPQSIEWPIAILSSMILTLIASFQEDLLFLSALIYALPQVCQLQLDSTINLYLLIDIIWLILSGYFQSGQIELLFIISISFLSIWNISIYTKFSQLRENNFQLEKKCVALEQEISCIEASRLIPSFKRTAELVEKLKKLSNSLMPNASRQSLHARFKSEVQLDRPEILKRSASNEVSNSNFITNDEIKEIIASLISQDYLICNQGKIKASEFNLAEIGKNQMDLYTQVDDSLPETTVRAKHPEPGKSFFQRLTTMKSYCDDNESLSEALEELGTWDFDSFKLIEYVNNPAFEVGRFVFRTLGLTTTYDIDDHKLNRFLTAVESGYKKKNYYHNSLHAADVTASAVFLIQEGIELGNGLADIDIFSLIIAALCHDIGHPGVNNPFLVASKDPLAFKYNDQSVLEHMHTNTTFQILSEDKTNILVNLTKSDYQRFRKITIQTILGTDLQIHFDKLADFKSMLSKRLTFSDDKFKLLALQMCIKCADIGHGAKTLDLHKKWSNLITKEFFKQGDLERGHGFTVTPLCDKDSVIISKSQEGFLKVLVRPLFESWLEFLELHVNKENTEEALSSFHICITNIQSNIEFWDNEYRLFKEGKQEFFLDELLPPLLKKHSTQIMLPRFKYN
ncbi:unnamed protein product [Blepharisma stoltei]|uniref:Phosphodiesterase n=1 Tax=Blepharisma stoltei TaxID=1481888 RepID=A0AAU9JU32_9CILI|nr:unnamed protein product [Blepharisma stoltei]